MHSFPASVVLTDDVLMRKPHQLLSENMIALRVVLGKVYEEFVMLN